MPYVFNPFTGTLDLTGPPTVSGAYVPVAGGTITPTANTTTTFQVDTAGSVAVLDVDTTNSRVGINTSTPTAGLHVASGDVLFGATPTATGALYYNAANFFGLWDGSQFNGIANALPAPTVNGHPAAALGGYFAGLGIGAHTSGGGTPMFGVLSSTQSNAGIGNVAFTVYDNNKIVTYSNTVDDGSGNVIQKGSLTVAGQAAPALSPVSQGRIYYDGTLNHFYYSENGTAYQQFGTGTGGGTLATQDIQRDFTPGSGTWYSGIAAKGSALTASVWSLIKTVVTSQDSDVRQIYTATDTWTNRAAATYTLADTYTI